MTTALFSSYLFSWLILRLAHCGPSSWLLGVVGAAREVLDLMHGLIFAFYSVQ